MPTILPGQVGTENVLANQIKIDMGTKVFGYDPPGNPYTRIMTKRLTSKPAKDRVVRWMEDDIVPFWDLVNGAVTNVATTVIVDNGAYFLAGDLVKNTRTGEVFQITSIATNTLTVVRGWGATSGAAMNDNDWLLNLRIASEEGSTSPVAKATLKVEKTNNTQIVKTPVHITETNRAVSHYHGDEEAYQIRQAGERHGRSWENIGLHGVKEDVAGVTHRVRSAGGLDEIITTNVLDVSATGVLTESEFRDWLTGPFRYRVNGGQGGTKLALVGPAIKNTIDSWGLMKLQMNEKARATYGMDIFTYIGSTGRLEVIYDPLLENGHEGIGYVVDPDGTMFRPLRSTHLEMNIQPNDEDGRKHQYLTEATFQFALEKAFGKITGVAF